MFPQDVALNAGLEQLYASSESQKKILCLGAYLFHRTHVNLTLDCITAIDTTERGTDLTDPLQFDRSHRCPRASSFLPCFRLSPASRLAHSRKKKSTSWSIPSPSRSSPSTPASTSKKLSGRACPLASTFLSSTAELAPTKEGRIC